MFDLRVPESMADLPSRHVIQGDEHDGTAPERFIADRRAFRNRYNTDEERKAARRAAWRAYAARNRAGRVAATKAWRAKKEGP